MTAVAGTRGWAEGQGGTFSVHGGKLPTAFPQDQFHNFLLFLRACSAYRFGGVCEKKRKAPLPEGFECRVWRPSRRAFLAARRPQRLQVVTYGRWGRHILSLSSLFECRNPS